MLKIMSVISMRFPMLLMLAVLAMSAGSYVSAADEPEDAVEVELTSADGSDADAADHEDGHDDHVGDGHAEGDHQHDGDDGHGDEAEGGLLSFDFGSAMFNVLIFLFVFSVLSAFVWPNVLGGLRAREDKIRSDLQAAEQANSDAAKLLKEYQVKLDDAAQQVQSMLAEARNDAQATGQRIVDEAKQEASRQQERAVAEIQTAKKVALSEIAGQTSDLAIKLAGSVVGRELNEQEHSELIRQSLDRLPSNN
ncbi:ATP synthase subunit b [Crateriforma conspicua]|uniref:ATP synthase subunit b n=2 Tax=Crateriforma conspicua TaxID=2527996 RepID=A0A5C5Y7M1_9PLAN|nr:ATP synthase subunit b [Crateriforma conspicua]